jgi:thiosulfate/3-mercaptopyruvate sulfurtransferase
MKPLLAALPLVLAVAIAADVKEIVQPKEVAARLSASGAKPVMIMVGANFLYRQNHIPGSIFGGQGSKPEGLEILKAAAAKLSKDSEIVLYCGCCPWDKCPNLNPAVAMLKEMGFTKVKAMMVPDTFKKDWTDKGYPVEQSLDLEQKK